MELSFARLRILLPVLLLGCFNKLDAQKPDASKLIPPFDIELTSSKHFKAEDLEKETPVILIYFDPSCEHCQAFTADMLKHYNEFGNTQIVMITYTPISEVVKFANDFSIANYPNINIGTEGDSFLVMRFYNASKFPFIALYDKSGIITAYHREPTTATAILKELKQ